MRHGRGKEDLAVLMIYRELMKRRFGLTIKEICAMFNCSPRTVYRKIKAIEDAGVPIIHDRSDHICHYYVNRDFKKREIADFICAVQEERDADTRGKTR